MNFTCAGTKIPKLVITELQNLLAQVNFKLTLIFYWCLHTLLNKGLPSKHHFDDDSPGDYRPSSLLVPVPVTSRIGVELIKKKLPVIEFGTFLERLDMRPEGCTECAICLSSLERCDEIRELFNCCHAFHRRCLDQWVEKSHVTCPLCRSKLLPHHWDDGNGGDDPWRVERIAYLFGEDYVMATW
ncbi:E3 ubiquitin-protein ligase RHA1B-like [Cornus florida]|uniref:E3 ubiquitin-protein ligase RHA1B-like n=1 Tax=Cornus florida TaxID=4283 RepID=UPI0028967B0E|nr:E3 ubiquitin-protein ligase RHA1B-like [Cornus florida]